MEEKKERIANNVIRVPTSIDNFFRVWVEFFTPKHSLSNREKDIFAAFLKKRFYLSQSITDQQLLDSVLMNEETKAEIKRECGVSDAFFSGILGKLRKANVIRNNVIDPIFIPKNLKPDDKYFKFMVLYDLQQ